MRPQKVSFGEMREMDVRGNLIYCAEHHCSHSVALSDLEPRFVCRACGKRGADVRPDVNWNSSVVPAMGYR